MRVVNVGSDNLDFRLLSFPAFSREPNVAIVLIFVEIICYLG
jgi:hypothetical protein